jgi:hypothetical protein
MDVPLMRDGLVLSLNLYEVPIIEAELLPTVILILSLDGSRPI